MCLWKSSWSRATGVAWCLSARTRETTARLRETRASRVSPCLSTRRARARIWTRASPRTACRTASARFTTTREGTWWASCRGAAGAAGAADHATPGAARIDGHARVVRRAPSRGGAPLPGGAPPGARACAPPRAHTLAVADARDVSRLSAFGDVRRARARLLRHGGADAPRGGGAPGARRVAQEGFDVRRLEKGKRQNATGRIVRGGAGARRRRGVVGRRERRGRARGVRPEASLRVRDARVGTADARDVFDRDAAYDAAFDADWRAWTEPSARGGKFRDVRLRRVEAAGARRG